MFAGMLPLDDRVWVHLDESTRRVIEIGDLYWLEADGHDTWLRFGKAKRLKDVRSLGEVVAAFGRCGLIRVHKNHAVNAKRIFEVRRRQGSRDWELKLEPPVNKVLPVSRNYLDVLKTVFGEGSAQRE